MHYFESAKHSFPLTIVPEINFKGRFMRYSLLIIQEFVVNDPHNRIQILDRVALITVTSQYNSNDLRRHSSDLFILILFN